MNCFLLKKELNNYSIRTENNIESEGAKIIGEGLKSNDKLISLKLGRD